MFLRCCCCYKYLLLSSSPTLKLSELNGGNWMEDVLEPWKMSQHLPHQHFLIFSSHHYHVIISPYDSRKASFGKSHKYETSLALPPGSSMTLLNIAATSSLLCPCGASGDVSPRSTRRVCVCVCVCVHSSGTLLTVLSIEITLLCSSSLNPLQTPSDSPPFLHQSRPNS